MTDLRALAGRLREADPSRHHVVTLPDFFVDHFVRAPKWDVAVPAWKAVHARGGGNVPTPGQHFHPGGNAANTALALARLGARVHFVGRTSPFGKAYLEATLGRMGVDLKHVRDDGDLAITTAIEFQEERPANVMLSDPGSVAQYGPEELTANDWTLVEAADFVLVANWSQNRRGSSLVEKVSVKARMTMVDAGDPSMRGEEGLAELRTRILPLESLDVFALNENELRQLTGADSLDAARSLRSVGALDLHTADLAASFTRDGEAVARTFRVDPIRVTGAGDSWNAGNILGYLLGFEAEDRLVLANAVAGLYVGGKQVVAPTLDEVASFLDSDPKFNE